jgi:hypothetical protein
MLKWGVFALDHQLHISDEFVFVSRLAVGQPARHFLYTNYTPSL